MQSLHVIHLNDSGDDKSIDAISLRLNGLEKHELNMVPWSAYAYKPTVQFSIAHNNKNIFLKYYVTETSIRANATTINGSVWEDSCVEFFISFDDQGYYNLEFNCIGTALVGFGPERSGRVLLAEELIKKIRFETTIKNKDDQFQWELVLVVPTEIFRRHSISSLKDITARANFYKCGDALPRPHFISWAPIKAQSPNFHLPQFFGMLVFE